MDFAHLPVLSWSGIWCGGSIANVPFHFTESNMRLFVAMSTDLTLHVGRDADRADGTERPN
jgi:hypothetical protein